MLVATFRYLSNGVVSFDKHLYTTPLHKYCNFGTTASSLWVTRKFLSYLTLVCVCDFNSHILLDKKNGKWEKRKREKER
jgi:hypothetical protein